MLTVRPLHSVNQTGSEMERLVRTYHADIDHLVHLPLKSFYDLTKRLPYKPDPKFQEFVQRPSFTLSGQARHRDCDDKAVLMGAYLYKNNVPFRFVAVSHRKDRPLHHVLLQANIGGKNKIIDPTYPKNRLFHFAKPERFYPITRWIK